MSGRIHDIFASYRLHLNLIDHALIVDNGRLLFWGEDLTNPLAQEDMFIVDTNIDGAQVLHLRFD